MKKTRYQIRDENFGLALYEAESSREALLQFFADRTRGELRGRIREDEDGTATITVDGKSYRTVAI